MRSILRGFLIGLLIPLFYILREGLREDRTLAGAFIYGLILVIPFATAGAWAGAAWFYVFELDAEEGGKK